MQEQTLEVRYKGVPFLVNTEIQESGRKVAVHEYPGTDSRTIDDLGQLPSIFRIEGYVAGSPKDTSDWASKAEKLTKVLQEPTEGFLQMSSMGIVRVKAQNFTKTVDQRALGRTRFSITFLVTDPQFAVDVTTIQDVSSSVATLLNEVESWFSDSYQIPTEANEFEVAGYDGESIVGEVGDKTASLSDQIDTITTAVNNVRTNINDFIRDPAGYAAALFGSGGVFGEVFGLSGSSTNPVSFLKSLRELMRVGYNLAVDFELIGEGLTSGNSLSYLIPVFADDARYRLLNNDNRLLITNSSRLCAMGICMDQACRSTYTTDDEINEVIADIQEAYEEVVLETDIDPLVALSLDRARTAALDVLQVKLQNTPNIEPLQLKRLTSDIELAYRLYANDFTLVSEYETMASVLTDLNDVLPTRFNGEVKVLR